MGDNRTTTFWAASRDAVARRRAEVAAVRLTNPRLCVREICSALAARGCTRPDGKPWARPTVQGDIAWHRQRWLELADRTHAELVAGELEHLNAARTAAWESGDLQIVLQVHQSISKLLGLAAPTRVSLTATASPAIDDEVVASAMAKMNRVISKAVETGRRAALPAPVEVMGFVPSDKPVETAPEPAPRRPARSWQEERRRRIEDAREFLTAQASRDVVGRTTKPREVREDDK